MATEKLIFNGTPAQVCAVLQQYESDTWETSGFSIFIDAPTKEVIEPAYQPLTLPGAKMERLFDMVMRGAGTTTRHIVDLRPDSPRTSVTIVCGNVMFGLSALQMPNDQTQITLTARDDDWQEVKRHWGAVFDYMSDLGWLDRVQAPDNLTEREREIAICLAKGMSNREIANFFVIADGTAKKHRQSIAQKWGVGETLVVVQIEARRRGYGRGK